MKPHLSHPVFELTDRLRSSLRTGRGLRLDPSHVQVLISEEIYHAICKLEVEEIRKACVAANINDNNSATSGCGSVPIPALGASAGSNVVPLDATSRGARQLLREEAALMRRRKMQRTH